MTKFCYPVSAIKSFYSLTKEFGANAKMLKILLKTNLYLSLNKSGRGDFSVSRVEEMVAHGASRRRANSQDPRCVLAADHQMPKNYSNF